MESKSYNAGFKAGLNGTTSAYKPGNRTGNKLLMYNVGFSAGYEKAMLKGME